MRLPDHNITRCLDIDAKWTLTPSGRTSEKPRVWKSSVEIANMCTGGFRCWVPRMRRSVPLQDVTTCQTKQYRRGCVISCRSAVSLMQVTKTMTRTTDGNSLRNSRDSSFQRVVPVSCARRLYTQFCMGVLVRGSILGHRVKKALFSAVFVKGSATCK